MFSRRNSEPVPEENTEVWLCSNDECIGWMRDNFTFDEKPTCPLCQSSMIQGDKVLPVLVNNNSTKK